MQRAFGWRAACRPAAPRGHAPGHRPLAAGEPARSPFFCGDFLHYLNLEIALRHRLLQPPILRLELPQALDILLLQPDEPEDVSELSCTSTRPVVNAVYRSPNSIGTADALSASIRGTASGPSTRILSPAKSAGDRNTLFELKCLKPPDSHHPRTRISVLVRRPAASFCPNGPSKTLQALCSVGKR